jgi:hypothetical protein
MRSWLGATGGIALALVCGCHAIDEHERRAAFEGAALQLRPAIERLRRAQAGVGTSVQAARATVAARAGTPLDAAGVMGVMDARGRLRDVAVALDKVHATLPRPVDPSVGEAQRAIEGAQRACGCLAPPDADVACLGGCEAAIAGACDAIDRMSGQARRLGVVLGTAREGDRQAM